MKIPFTLRLNPNKTKKQTIGNIEIMDGIALENYLKDFSQEEIRQARILWNTHAARKELINFEANGTESKV